MVRIEKIVPTSIAEQCGIEAGDYLLSINEHEINDVLDYRFYLAEEEILLEIKKEEEILVFEIEIRQTHHVVELYVCQAVARTDVVISASFLPTLFQMLLKFLGAPFRYDLVEAYTHRVKF